MVHKVKNIWFQQKAKDVELRILHGKSGGVWRCIRNTQRRRGGLVSTKPKAIRNSEGILYCTLAESVQRWREHFDHALNIPGQSFYMAAVVDIINRCGHSINVYHRNQPNKSKLAMYKP